MTTGCQSVAVKGRFEETSQLTEAPYPDKPSRTHWAALCFIRRVAHAGSAPYFHTQEQNVLLSGVLSTHSNLYSTTRGDIEAKSVGYSYDCLYLL